MALACVSAGGVPELHPSAAGEREQAVYLRNQRLHPHLHQPNGTASASPVGAVKLEHNFPPLFWKWREAAVSGLVGG